MIRKFEEISNNAWPALRVFQYDGWLLRFANGVTKRSNSVSLLYPSTLDPVTKIAFCEDLYRSAGIPPCLKVTPDSEPKEIDRILEEQGYTIHSHISFQTASLKEMSGERDPQVFLEEKPDPEWIDHFIHMNGFDIARKPTYLAILEQLVLPVTTATIFRDGKVAAVGLGVLEDRYLGIFDIVVDPAFRKRGLGYTVTSALMQRGREMGADTAYLQVLCDNLPALRLYERLGFREIYRYWYRMKD
ncbi:MAG TPA: GNAT family N-acetyltransferase [Bacteroidales bacterium]|nr:GNAT family N-acetyltransferase [Bacteroidales bacterium]HPS63175.1 GNAT family N-acetyltransferase [Bacteroidales bacterium]